MVFNGYFWRKYSPREIRDVSLSLGKARQTSIIRSRRWILKLTTKISATIRRICVFLSYNATLYPRGFIVLRNLRNHRCASLFVLSLGIQELSERKGSRDGKNYVISFEISSAKYFSFFFVSPFLSRSSFYCPHLRVFYQKFSAHRGRQITIVKVISLKTQKNTKEHKRTRGNYLLNTV